MNEQTTTEPNRLLRGVLFLVMGAALTVGTWSIYTLLTVKFGAPKKVAVFGSGMFDGAALYFALLAQRYATSPDSGLAPRLAMLAMVTASSWVNWTHAQLEGWGIVGGILLAPAPVIAEVAFEMWHRYEHREALRDQGRVQSALPVIPGLAWLLFPKKSAKVMRASVGAQLDVVEREAQHAASPADAHRLERTTAPRHAVTAEADGDAQRIVITLQQPHAITASPAGRQHAAHDAPNVVARQRRDTAPRIITVPQAASDDAHPGDALAAPHDVDFAAVSKAAAVRAMRDAHPDAAAQQIADALAPHGITVTANYVRTVCSRASSGDPQQGTGGYL
ncbi:DUF2637 domain-containing protein [Kitasatospora sp. NBC_00240]|uniref:DUF2637 domain-containing protein n=1 Tax=Kitasatospora sp. NBC_00240 TaxID=2903567 RepID=UPI00225AD124|nr:DUF2637 domain-containing protein [Kitasatospora sp. NBC_00240]MCX5209797.1 DUF2637 domain-containing protein [Kitasatospora sp. NBC_00240]